MTLIKTSLLNAIAQVIKLLTLFGLNKILAVYLGPSGFAMIGQFQNVIGISTSVASGAVNTGVTKHTAEQAECESQHYSMWSTAFLIAMTGTILLSFLLNIFRSDLSQSIFHTDQYENIFLWLSFSIPLLVINNLLLAILNGKREIHTLVLANIAGSLSSLGVVGALSIFYGLNGALIGLTIFQSIALFATLFLCRKFSWFKLKHFFLPPKLIYLKALSKYAIMSLTAIACVHGSQLVIRGDISSSLSFVEAGYWDAMNKLSSAYLGLVISILSVYYLPKLAQIKSPKELRIEVIAIYKLLLPFMLIATLCIFLLKNEIIKILFTDDFIPMRALFSWQLVGDVFKMGSWVVAYIMVGRSLIGRFIFLEIFFASTLIAFSYFFIRIFGIEGSAMAYTVNYFLYWIVVSFMVRKQFSSTELYS